MSKFLVDLLDYWKAKDYDERKDFDTATEKLKQINIAIDKTKDDFGIVLYNNQLYTRVELIGFKGRAIKELEDATEEYDEEFNEEGIEEALELLSEENPLNKEDHDDFVDRIDDIFLKDFVHVAYPDWDEVFEEDYHIPSISDYEYYFGYMYEEYNMTGQELMEDIRDLIETAYLDPSKRYDKRRRLGEKITRAQVETIFDNREY